MTRPDIIVRYSGEPVLIVDTKWKRLSPSIDDPKQGVSQGDVYQMMAYGQIYDCHRLMLLYPHHNELGMPPGLTSSHKIVGGEKSLVTATFDLSDLRHSVTQLAQLLSFAPRWHKRQHQDLSPVFHPAVE